MKIAILAHHSAGNAELARLTAENKWKYSAKHGYDLITLRTSGEEWKVGVTKRLRQILPAYDAVMTMGSDVLLMNHGIKIEDRFSVATDSVVISREDVCEWPLNNDIAIWCNTPRTFEVIDRIIADADIWLDYPWLWQNHLWNLIANKDPVAIKGIRLCDPRELNATHGNGQNSRWQFGDFIIHFLGYPEDQKIALVKHYLAMCSTDGTFHPPGTLFNRIKRKECEDVDPKAVFIAMPTYDGQARVETMQSLLFFLQWAASNMPDWTFTPAHLAGTGVPKLRDMLVHMARHSRTSKGKRFGKLFFWDSDVAALPQQVQRIISHSHPVIGGLYPLKKKGLAWVWKPIPGTGPDKAGVQNVAGVGTGFKCFDMAVFEAYAQAHPELEYTNNDLDDRFAGKKMTLFFREDVVDGHRMPEDYYFDRRVMEMGIPVSADTTIRLGHVGPCDWLAVNSKEGA